MTSVLNLFLITLSLVQFALCNETFLYYAYGSNLLAKRILINNPSAVFVGIAKLESYRLDFISYSPTWYGAPATIVEDPGKVVWGALWRLDTSNLPSLDIQEGVDIGWYFAKDVNVTTPTGNVLTARTYEQTINPSYVPPHQLPEERKPSTTYLNVIIDGAKECLLPADYISYLRTFASNGKVASDEIRRQLEQIP